MSRKVAFKTLGCRLNQFETDSLVTDFYKAGYKVVAFDEKADVYVINTCTVTNQGDRKSKYAINQAVRSAGNDSIVVVAGCMVTSQKEYLENRTDITYVVENKTKSSVLPLVDSHFKGELVHPSGLKQDTFNYSVVEKGFHTRSAIKIQDGCDNFCTYCIVPKVRGRAVSRPVRDILENVRKTVDLGNKELVLTGVNISRYEHEGVKFDDLIEKILAVEGDFRVRISSIEPEGFSDKLTSQFANPKLCPHLHLCMQSGSDKVLQRMRRFYTIEQFMHIVNQIRSKFADFNFTTDVIVGFPGETEKEFQDTLKIITEIGFSHIHTFKFSRRSGTKADQLENQISERVKDERSKIVREAGEKLKLEYRSKFINKEQNLLVERNNSRGGARGYGQHYLPVLIKGEQLRQNEFYNVRINGILDDKERTMTALLV